MDEMRGDREILRKLRLCFHQGKNFLPAHISIAADQAIHLAVLPKAFNSGGKDDELPAVLNCHTRAVDCFVSEPCALKFARVQINNAFFNRVFKMRHIARLALCNGGFKQRAGIAEIQPVQIGYIARICGTGQNIKQGQIFEKMLLRIIKNAPHGGEILAHDAFQPVKCAEHVACIDHGSAAAADKDVFGIIRHTDDLMRHDLPDGNDQIIRRVQKAAVDLNINCGINQALRNRSDKVGGHFSDFFDIRAPVMHDELFVRDAVPEKGMRLLPCHGDMRTERRHDIHLGTHRKHFV